MAGTKPRGGLSEPWWDAAGAPPAAKHYPGSGRCTLAESTGSESESAAAHTAPGQANASPLSLFITHPTGICFSDKAFKRPYHCDVRTIGTVVHPSHVLVSDSQMAGHDSALESMAQ